MLAYFTSIFMKLYYILAFLSLHTRFHSPALAYFTYSWNYYTYPVISVTPYKISFSCTCIFYSYFHESLLYHVISITPYKISFSLYFHILLIHETIISCHFCYSTQRLDVSLSSIVNSMYLLLHILQCFSFEMLHWSILQCQYHLCIQLFNAFFLHCVYWEYY